MFKEIQKNLGQLYIASNFDQKTEVRGCASVYVKAFCFSWGWKFESASFEGETAEFSKSLWCVCK